MSNPIDHAVATAAALRQLNLTHATHDVLCAVAKFQAAGTTATVPGLAIHLRCSFQNVMQQISGYPELFDAQTAAECRRLPVRRITLSVEGLALLHQIAAKTTQCLTPIL